MIRLVWRQFRTQAAVGFGTLAVIAVVAVITCPHLVHLYDTNVATCGVHGDCSTATNAFLGNDSTLRTWLGILVIVVPGIIGIFWGAPLVARELEAGTHRLVWTQSVTRTRWMATKLGVIGVASMALAGLLSLIVTWWASPLDRANMNVFGIFNQRDIVPIGYAAFAFVLGAIAGVLIRRTLPAMATALVAFVAARLAFIQLVRPHLIAPKLRDLALSLTSMGFGSTNGGPFTLEPNPPNIPNAWINSAQIVDKGGDALTPQFVATACPRLVAGAQVGGPATGSGHVSRAQVPAGAQEVLQNCVAKVGATYHEVVTYQPASHFWVFQWYELAVYLGAALLLTGACFWWVRRRLS